MLNIPPPAVASLLPSGETWQLYTSKSFCSPAQTNSQPFSSSDNCLLQVGRFMQVGCCIARHKARGTRHKTQDARRRAQDAERRTQNNTIPLWLSHDGLMIRMVTGLLWLRFACRTRSSSLPAGGFWSTCRRYPVSDRRYVCKYEVELEVLN